MSYRSMINLRDARHDARMKAQNRQDWKAIGLVALAGAIASLPVLAMVL